MCRTSVLSRFHVSDIKGSKATELADALVAAESSIVTRSAYRSAVSVVASQVDGEVFKSVANSGFPHITSTAPPTWFTGLPSRVQKEIYSAQSVLGSVYSSVTSTGEATRSTAGVVAGVLYAIGVFGLAAI
jgi:hypothetical protein